MMLGKVQTLEYSILAKRYLLIETREEKDTLETLNVKTEFNNAIRIWMRHVPYYKSLYPKELSDKYYIVETNLDIVDLKFLMKNIGEDFYHGLLLLIIK